MTAMCPRQLETCQTITSKQDDLRLCCVGRTRSDPLRSYCLCVRDSVVDTQVWLDATGVADRLVEALWRGKR